MTRPKSNEAHPASAPLNSKSPPSQVPIPVLVRVSTQPPLPNALQSRVDLYMPTAIHSPDAGYYNGL
jgi:hypothetical protein